MMSEVDWTRATVAELKEELKQKGLAITGKKDELLERLLASLAEDEHQEEEEAAEGELEQEEEQEMGGEQVLEEEQPEEEEEEEQPEEEEEQLEEEQQEELEENGEEEQEYEHQEEEEHEGDEGEQGEEHEGEHEQLMIGDEGTEFLEEDQIEDIVGEVDEMADFAQPSGIDSDEEMHEDQEGKDDEKGQEDEEDEVLENGELVIPNKRELRKDMLVDHRLKTVVVYPIQPSDLDNELLRSSFDSCLDFGTKFYNVTAEDGTQSIQGYAQLHFECYKDALAAVDGLKAIREGLTVKRQKPQETHEEFVAEVDRGKRIPLKSDETKGSLLVSDLPSGTTEQELRDAFSGALAVFVARDDDRKPKGYAYVDYGDRDAAMAALAAHKDVQVCGKKVILTDYHTKLEEGIPSDEMVEPDPTTGRLTSGQRDLLLRRLREMRNDLAQPAKKRPAERVELLERRIANIRAKLSKDSRARNQGRGDGNDKDRDSRTDRYHSHRSPGRHGGGDDRDYKRRRMNSWGSQGHPQSLMSMNRSYGRGGGGYQQANQAQTMNLLVGLSQMLNQQQQQQQMQQQQQQQQYRDRYRSQASSYQRQAGSQDRYYSGGSKWGSRRY